MNSRRVWMLLFVVGVIAVSALIVSAQPYLPSQPPGPFAFGNVGDLFTNILRFIANIFTLNWITSQEMFTGLGRFIIWLIVFTALYTGSAKLPGTWTPARRLIIAGAISFLSVLAIPQNFIIGLLSLFGGFVMFLFGVVILGLIIWADIQVHSRPEWAGLDPKIRAGILILLDVLAIVIVAWVGSMFQLWIYGPSPQPYIPPGLPVR